MVAEDSGLNDNLNGVERPVSFDIKDQPGVAAQIVNYSAEATRRVDVAVSASYDMAVQDVIDALVEAGMVDKALTEPAPFAAVTGYGASTIDYTLR